MVHSFLKTYFSNKKQKYNKGDKNDRFTLLFYIYVNASSFQKVKYEKVSPETKFVTDA